jgi:hypothetical protein
MITQELLNPKSIVVVGGSNNLSSPGGKVLKNLLGSAFKGSVYVVNPKEDEIQGMKNTGATRDDIIVYVYELLSKKKLSDFSEIHALLSERLHG